jgi:hypothetical protein
MNADEACETLVCPELATVRAHWPGQTKRFCQRCADRAKGVAAAMGFELTTEAIPGYTPPAIERTIELDGTACRDCGSDIGFCAPACSSQGRD